ncbi:DUF2339 domain-containing protein [Planctomycetota bacterium]
MDMQCFMPMLFLASLSTFIFCIILLVKVGKLDKTLKSIKDELSWQRRTARPGERPESREAPITSIEPAAAPEPEVVQEPEPPEERVPAEPVPPLPPQPTPKEPIPIEPDEAPEEVTAEGEPRPPESKVVTSSAEVLSQMRQKVNIDASGAREALEQRIGTKWILIVGVITTLIATGFFLRYAYDNDLIGPLGRVMITTAAGLLALGLGEWTRRRDFGIAARGLTAMGFAILYAAVFSASSFYHLIGTNTALGLSILVTVGAMFYAVGMNEILAAFLSLVGGYLAPIIVSTGENRPHALFGYVTILSIGAMLCAIFRKWRAVNLLAFFGTFGLYTGWFEKFYRPAARAAEAMPEQLPIALTWLGVFFVIFLVLPILYELVKRVNVKKEDVVLNVSNAVIVFYYLCMILFVKYRPALAVASLVVGAAHLGLKQVVNTRSRRDVPLRLSLLVISMFFVTVAIPMYLKMYAVAIAWAGEGVILTVIGIRYRNTWTRVGGFIALALSGVWLNQELPLHEAAFTIILNPAFGSWCFAATALYICHIIYRRTTIVEKKQAYQLTQVLFCAFWVVLLAAALMEWYYHTRFNLIATPQHPYQHYLSKGYVVILTAFMLLLLVRPICPAGRFWSIGAAILGGIVSALTLVDFPNFYHDRFAIFANGSFAIGITCVAGLFAGAVLLRREITETPYNRQHAFGFVLAGLAVLWVLLTEEIYLYWKFLGWATDDVERCAFLGQMYISVMWAVYAAILMSIGFWKKSKVFRYIALGLILLVILKVFIFDMSNLKSAYRIAGFGVLGITLVGISYLYQYGKKKGMFTEVTMTPEAEDIEE